jgi:uncharacterized membrane-anchored protein
MSPFRSRCRLLAGLSVLLTSGCLSNQPLEARDGRSRTPPASIEDLPGPSSRAHRSVIVDIAPLQPLDQRAPTTAAASPIQAAPLGGSAKVAASFKRPTQSSETGPEGRPSVEKAPAVPAPVAVPPGEPQGVESPALAEVKSAGGPSDESPAVAGNGSIVLAPTASNHWVGPIAPSSGPAGGLNLDLDVKQSFSFVETGASSLDGTAQAIDPPFMELSAPKPQVVEIAEAQPPAQQASSLRESFTEADAGSGGALASTPNPIVPRGEARNPKRGPTLSAFAKDVQLISNVIPPMQPPKAAQAEENAALPGGQQAWESSRMGFQLPMAWLSEPLASSPGAPATAPAAEPEIKASEFPTEGVDQKARKAEQERKSQFWRRLAATQTARKALEEQQPKAASQSKLLGAINQLVRGAPQTPEERAYASLLQEGVRGPMRLRIADRATLWLPFGYVFLDAEKARDLIDGEEGVLDNSNFGVILPSGRTPTWMAYVDLIDQGHIKEGDAKALAPAALLTGVAGATAAQNVERGRNGMAPLTVVDWIAVPKYLPSKHILNSCISAVDGANLDPQARLINCASLALGRRGAIKILVAGELANLVSFEREAAALTEKIAYDPAAGYEGYVAGEDEDAGYGLVFLASGIVGLKTIAAPVAAAGAGKAQDLLVYKILSYWEAILTALIAAALGVYWFLRNRPKSEEESEASRQAVHMPFWKAALWATRCGLRRLFEKRAPPARVAAARAEPAEKQSPSPLSPARLKSALAAWRERLVSILSVLRSRGGGPSERDADLAAEISAGGGSSAGVDAGQAKIPPRGGTTSRLASARAQAERGAAPSPAPGPATVTRQASASSLTDSVSANAGDLNRLASLMRRKDKLSAPSSHASGQSPRADAFAARAAESGAQIEQDRSEEAKKGGLDLFDLVEPGDAEAVSMAVSAHEALQKAQG